MSTADGMSWTSVPPAATLSTCAPRQIARSGRSACHRAAGQVDLELIAPRLRVLDRRVPLLAVERGIDVAAAGQQQPVDLRQALARALADLENARSPAGLLDRRDVVVHGLQRVMPMVGAGFHVHIFSGTVQPISSSAFVSCAR